MFKKKLKNIFRYFKFMPSNIFVFLTVVKSERRNINVN